MSRDTTLVTACPRPSSLSACIGRERAGGGEGRHGKSTLPRFCGMFHRSSLIQIKPPEPHHPCSFDGTWPCFCLFPERPVSPLPPFHVSRPTAACRSVSYPVRRYDLRIYPSHRPREGFTRDAPVTLFSQTIGIHTRLALGESASGSPCRISSDISSPPPAWLGLQLSHVRG